MNDLKFPIIASLFILFALSRALLQFRNGALSWRALLFWVVIWGGAGFIILYPRTTGNLASSLGVSRGSDVIVYTSVIVIFYLLFRIYVYLNEVNYNLTRVVRQIALDEVTKTR